MSDMSFKDDADELIKALESDKTVVAPVLRITDETVLASKYLSPLAQERLSVKATSQVIQVPGTMKAYMAVYLCTRVRDTSIEKAVCALAGVLNVLADKGYIHSCLANFASLPLAQMPMEHPSSVVLCFPLVPADKIGEVKEIAGKLMTEEGGCGDKMESIEKELSEGLFFAEIRIYHNSMMLSKSVEDKLEYQIQKYLNVLPKGTEVISKKQCAIVDLSILYEVVFFNPLMKAFKEVRLQQMRHCAIVDGNLEQFNLLTGIEYIKR